MKSRIIIVGPGGSGKDFLAKKFIDRGFKKSISYTTRPPRPGEIDDFDYYFRNESLFIDKPYLFYEVAKFNGWYYGTSLLTWETSDIFIMTPSGIANIDKEDRKNCFIIYINPDKEIIRERLSQRHDADNVERRIEADMIDFKDFTDFDMEVKNHDF